HRLLDLADGALARRDPGLELFDLRAFCLRGFLLFACFGVRTFFFGVIDPRLRRWRSWSAFFLPFLPVPPFPPLLPFLPWSLLRMFLVPEKLFVRSRVDEGCAVSHVDDLRRQPLDEGRIVRDDKWRFALVAERCERYS